jgi:hypothetical protein
MPFSAFYHVAEEKKSTLSPKKKGIKANVNIEHRGYNSKDKNVYIDKRMRDRKAAKTEGEISIFVFLRTFFLYELPPPFLGGLICWLIDGYHAANGRRLIPSSNTIGGWFGYLIVNFLSGMPIWACGLAFLLKSDTETEWSIVEPLQMIVYYVLWKFTLAAKHSLSNKLDHEGFYGMNSPRYGPARRLERMQFACWILNNGSNQPGAVLEELYTASLRADCDLSKLHFDFGSESIARNVVGHVVRWKLKAATSLKFQGKAIDIPKWHPQHPEHINVKLLNVFKKELMNEEDGSNSKATERMIEIKTNNNSNNNHAHVPATASPYIVTDQDNSNEKNIIEDYTNNLLPTLSISKYAEDDTFCLFREYFKQTNDPESAYVEQLLLQGKVPATYIAFLIGVENWRADAGVLAKVNLTAMFLCLLMAFLPAIFRALIRDDHIAFGVTQNAQYVFGFGFVGSMFPIFMLFGYLIHCSLEMNFRLKASQFLRKLLLPEGAYVLGAKFPFEEYKVSKETGKGRKKKPSKDIKKKNGIRIHISLQQSSNIIAWGATRELLHGASFCPFQHAKTQAYVASSFGAAILVTSIASFGAAIIAATNGGSTSGATSITVSLPAVINSIIFSITLSIYILLAYRVNFSTRYQRQEIAKARLAVLSEINDLEKRLLDLKLENNTSSNNIGDGSSVVELKRRINEMHNCSMLLQVVDKQTTVSDHANPVKAMGLVADPAVLSIMISILAASVWIEIQNITSSMTTQ